MPLKSITLLLLFPVALFSQTIELSNIKIARDSYGVPHIFTKTDVEAAYGLAWAHSEDDFRHIQENLIAAKGRLGEVLGKEGAIFDFGLQFLGIDTLVKNNYDKKISPEFKKVIEAYCSGLNAYAASHPKEVLLKNALPFTPIDIIAGYTLTQSLMSGVGYALKIINENRIELFSKTNETATGSNAIAISGRNTSDGKSYLAVNSHQPLEGRFAWYEAHICSEEGWNMIGALLPGGVSIIVGSSPDLGWAHTNNFNTWGDIYKLEINPENKNQYRYDGQWKDLIKRKIKLKAKVAGLKLGVNKSAPLCEFGPVLVTKHGLYAIRFPAYMDMRGSEQWWKMNKARNFKEFEEAIKMECLPSFNIIYADKENNILFQCAGHYPNRDKSLNWKLPIRSGSSKHKWTSLLPWDCKPLLINPDCGYVYNANNTPLNASGKECNWVGNFAGLQLFDNNRGERLSELMNSHKGKFSWEDFKRIKFDKAYSDTGMYVKKFSKLLYLEPAKYPDIADAIQKLKQWDLKGNKDNPNAAIAMLTHHNLADEFKGPFTFLMVRDNLVSEDEAVRAMRKTKKFLLDTHHTLDVKLGDVQRHIRGRVSYPVSGLSEVLMACDTKIFDKKKGIYRMTQGDSYIQLVKFGKDGIELNTVNAYGASAHPESVHYTDQMELYVNEKTKPMTFDKAKILKDAVRVYSPGK